MRYQTSFRLEFLFAPVALELFLDLILQVVINDVMLQVSLVERFVVASVAAVDHVARMRPFDMVF